MMVFFMLSYSLQNILQGSNKISSLSLLKVLPSITFLIFLWSAKSVSLSEVILWFYGLLGFYSILILIYLKPKFVELHAMIKLVTVENSEFGRKVYFGTLANVGTSSLGALLIGFYLDNVHLGFFTLAVTITSPLLMIPSIVGTTFFKQFAKIPKIDNRILLLTVTISLISLIAFNILIEPIVKSFYSSKFDEVIGYSRFIALASIFHGFGDFYNRFLFAKGYGKLIRNGAYIVGLVNLLGYFILINYFGVNGAIITKVLSGAVYFLLMFAGYRKSLKMMKLTVT
jgi:O-antigen/teichoic acid export membrane protein